MRCFRFGLVAVAVLVSLVWGVPHGQATIDWTGSATILEFNYQPSTGLGASQLFLTVPAGTFNPSTAACTVRTGFYLSVTTDHQKRLFAMLLSARLAGRSVRMWVTDVCHVWGHAEIDGVIID